MMFFVGSSFVTALAQETKWLVVKPSGAEFKAEFPGRPTREARLLPEESVLIKSNVHELVVYDLVADNIRYQVMSFSKAFTAPDKFEGTLDSFAVGFERACLNANPSEKKSIVLEQGLPDNARQYQVRIGDYRGVLRLYETKYHFCAVIVIHAAAGGDSETARFLSGFKLSSLNKQFPDKDVGEDPQPQTPPELWSADVVVASSPISVGVLNGKAIEFPVPGYPNEARKSRASGQVSVQVIVGEDGKVISAKALEGPEVLYEAATKAALKARFSKTRAGGRPIQVTGVLIYNFVYGR
jgi:TonB family protein